MAIFVLVHGAWHGGWCWKRLSPLLRAAGHDVYTPTLTGLGERAHLLTPEVNLRTHIDDIVQVLHYEDLSDVLLVGHSYAGLVISGVADRVPDRLAQLIYLDAYVPRVGENVEEALGPGTYAQLAEQARTTGEGWFLPSPPPGDFGITADADVMWMQERLRPHPLGRQQPPLRLLTTPAAGALARAFIFCTATTQFESYAEWVRTDSAWRYAELAAGHDAMVTAPYELARVLIGLA